MPPILIGPPHHPALRTTLKTGDVLMVAASLKDKTTGEPYTWRYFGVVVKANRMSVTVIRIGVEPPKRDQFSILLSDDRMIIHLLPEDEWPDGIYAFRTRLILEGRIDEAVF